MAWQTFDRHNAELRRRNAKLTKQRDELRAALEGVVLSWWAECVDFFGSDNKADFEALPAVMAARAALAKARGETDAG